MRIGLAAAQIATLVGIAILPHPNFPVESFNQQSTECSCRSGAESAPEPQPNVAPQRPSLLTRVYHRLMGAIVRHLLRPGMTKATVNQIACIMGGIHTDEYEFYSFNVIPSFYVITDTVHGLRLIFRKDKKGVFKFDSARCLPLFED